MPSTIQGTPTNNIISLNKKENQMRCGTRKIDKTMSDLVKSALKGGRWTEKNGRKHMKLVLQSNPAVWVTVPGSSRDPGHASKNLLSLMRRYEHEAGFTEPSI